MTAPSPEKPKLSLDEVNALSREDFVSTFGDVFEHSPWIAQNAFDERPFSSIVQLHKGLAKELHAAESSAKLTLIRAHPNLAAKAARDTGLTEFSNLEQTGAGLDTCTKLEATQLQSLNAQYEAKFGFPCIISVKGLNKQRIFKKFRLRLQSTSEEEFAENLKQILRIAKFRLEELVEG